MTKIIAVIPAYNEERSVGDVVRQTLKNATVTQCVVVNDGSTDGTAQAASSAGARVLHLKKNAGSGAAIRAGLQYAIHNRASAVVLLDADGQHNPGDITKLLRALSDTTDVVIGSRFMKPAASGTSRARRAGIKIISVLIGVFFGRKIYDPTSGFRVLNEKAARTLFHHYNTLFPEPETIIRIIDSGFHIREIPIEMKQRLFGRSSIRPAKGVVLMAHIVAVIGRNFLHRFVKSRDTVNA